MLNQDKKQEISREYHSICREVGLNSAHKRIKIKNWLSTTLDTVAEEARQAEREEIRQKIKYAKTLKTGTNSDFHSGYDSGLNQVKEILDVRDELTNHD